MQTLLPGITTERVPTRRLTMAVLSAAGRAGQPVLFLHGNVSSSLFWQPTMLALPEGYRPLALDLRGFGETDPEPVDATRGLRDYADDLAALIDALELTSVHLVGWSMGGGVVLQYLADHPAGHQAASVTLVAPVSPFGFGGTHGTDGILSDPPGGRRPEPGQPHLAAACPARPLRQAALRARGSGTGHLHRVDALHPARR